MEDKEYSAKLLVNPVASTETKTHVSVCAGTLEELKSKGRLLVHGAHRPILVIEEQDRVYALDNRCPHMGFPLDRGSVDLRVDAPSISGRTMYRPARRSAGWGGMGQG